MQSIWSGVPRFTIKAGMLAVVGATAALIFCFSTGRTSGLEFSYALIGAALVVEAIGLLPMFGGWNLRSSAQYQFMRSESGYSSFEQELRDSTNNVALFVICLTAAAPLFIAGMVLYQVAS